MPKVGAVSGDGGGESGLASCASHFAPRFPLLTVPLTGFLTLRTGLLAFLASFFIYFPLSLRNYRWRMLHILSVKFFKVFALDLARELEIFIFMSAQLKSPPSEYDGLARPLMSFYSYDPKPLSIPVMRYTPLPSVTLSPTLNFAISFLLL